MRGLFELGGVVTSTLSETDGISILVSINDNSNIYTYEVYPGSGWLMLNKKMWMDEIVVVVGRTKNWPTIGVEGFESF